MQLLPGSVCQENQREFRFTSAFILKRKYVLLGHWKCSYDQDLRVKEKQREQ